MMHSPLHVERFIKLILMLELTCNIFNRMFQLDEQMRLVGS